MQQLRLADVLIRRWLRGNGRVVLIGNAFAADEPGARPVRRHLLSNA